MIPAAFSANSGLVWPLITGGSSTPVTVIIASKVPSSLLVPSLACTVRRYTLSPLASVGAS